MSRRVLVVADHEPDEQVLRVQLESVAPRTDFELKTVIVDRRDHGGRRSQPEADEADRLQAIEDGLADFDADQIVMVGPSRGIVEKARARFDIEVTRAGGV